MVIASIFVASMECLPSLPSGRLTPHQALQEAHCGFCNLCLGPRTSSQLLKLRLLSWGLEVTTGDPEVSAVTWVGWGGVGWSYILCGHPLCLSFPVVLPLSSRLLAAFLPLFIDLPSPLRNLGVTLSQGVRQPVISGPRCHWPALGAQLSWLLNGVAPGQNAEQCSGVTVTFLPPISLMSFLRPGHQLSL